MLIYYHLGLAGRGSLFLSVMGSKMTVRPKKEQNHYGMKGKSVSLSPLHDWPPSVDG